MGVSEGHTFRIVSRIDFGLDNRHNDISLTLLAIPGCNGKYHLLAGIDAVTSSFPVHGLYIAGEAQRRPYKLTWNLESAVLSGRAEDVWKTLHPYDNMPPYFREQYLRQDGRTDRITELGYYVLEEGIVRVKDGVRISIAPRRARENLITGIEDNLSCNIREVLKGILRNKPRSPDNAPRHYPTMFFELAGKPGVYHHATRTLNYNPHTEIVTAREASR